MPFEKLIKIILDFNEMEIYTLLYNYVQIVHCCCGLVILDSKQKDDQKIKQLVKKINKISQHTWTFKVHNSQNGTIYQKTLYQKCKDHFLIKKIIEVFPDLEISDIKQYDLL